MARRLEPWDASALTRRGESVKYSSPILRSGDSSPKGNACAEGCTAVVLRGAPPSSGQKSAAAQWRGALPPCWRSCFGQRVRRRTRVGQGLDGPTTELRVLLLAGNNLSSALPDASYTRALHELNLSDNALAGWLPAALLRAPGLAVLGLANNYLAGELPAVGHEDEVFVEMPKRDIGGARR